MSDLAKLMAAVRGSAGTGAPGKPSAAPAPAPGERAAGTYVRSNGIVQQIEDMNPNHRAAAAAKARRAGDHRLADELEGQA